MATYKGIKGFKTQSLGSDPSPLLEGQVWYNTAGNALKFGGQGGAWASANGLITPRDAMSCSSTSTSSVIVAGGYSGGPPVDPGQTTTELYDGTSFATVNAMNINRAYGAGSGITTNGMAFGGEAGAGVKLSSAEYYNGTSWAGQPTMGDGRANLGGTGQAYTATLAYGGDIGPGTLPGATELFNGGTWSTRTAMNTGRRYIGSGGGSWNTALAIGGYGPTIYANVEEYNGTTWTEKADLNTARYNLGAAHEGAPTVSMAFGGEAPASTSAAETYDGTCWATVSSLGSARYGLRGAGSSTAAYATCGTPRAANNSEEWGFITQVKTVTTS